jgi:DNA-binding GntR family transcriptional regulator
MRAVSGPSYHLLNPEFHRTTYAAAGNRQRAELIESLRDTFEAYVRLDIVAQPDPRHDEEIRRQHEDIAQALHARLPKRARKLMQEHLESNRRHIATSVKLVRSVQSRAETVGSSIATNPPAQR